MSTLAHAPRNQEIPASYAQEVYWRWEDRYPGRYTWNVPIAFRLVGKLVPEALVAALSEIERRHEVLRTSLSLANGRLIQTIHPPRTVAVTQIDLRAVPDSERAAEADRLATEAVTRVFDVQKELLRGVLLRLGDEEHRIIVVIHHLAWDAMSHFPLFDELSALYDAFSQEKPSPLPELAVQYADWAVAQRETIASPAFQPSLAYWRKKLAGAAPLELPIDRPRPERLSLDAIENSFLLAGAELQALDKLSRAQSLPRSMALIAAVVVLLHGYTRVGDIVMSLPSVYRPKPELGKLIGLFLNSQIFRVTVPEGATFRDVMKSVAEASGEAQAHRDVPAQLALDCPGGAFESPLGRVVVNLRPTRVGRAKPSFAGLEVTRQPVFWRSLRRAELVFLMREGIGDLTVGIMGAADLFDPSTIATIAGDLKRLLEKVPSAGDVPVSSIAPAAITRTA